MDRRQLLLGGAALVGCKATVTPTDDTDAPPPEPAPVREPSPVRFDPGTADLDAFPWGVLVGDPTTDSAEVRVRTTHASVELVWMVHDGSSWTEAGRETLEPSITAAFRITGLPADSAVCVYAENGDSRSDVTRFRTAPDGAPERTIVFGASSCFAFSNAEMANLTHVRDADLDLFLQLGDYCYTDGSTTAEEYTARWDSYMVRDACRALAAGTALGHTWDDHEVDNNWTLTPGGGDSVTPEQLENATQVWREVIPMGPGNGGSGVWRKLAWGQLVDVFLLDSRGERSADGIVSEEQLSWVEAQLAASTARFKLVCVSVHLTDHSELFGFLQEHDRWQGYPPQRARLVAACMNTPGTLVITGDMHYGAVQRVDPEGALGWDLFEVAAGPSGSRLLPLDGVLSVYEAGTGRTGAPPQYDLLVEAWSWSRLSFDPNTGLVLIEFIGDDGSVIAEREVQL